MKNTYFFIYMFGHMKTFRHIFKQKRHFLLYLSLDTGNFYMNSQVQKYENYISFICIFVHMKIFRHILEKNEDI